MSLKFNNFTAEDKTSLTRFGRSLFNFGKYEWIANEIFSQGWNVKVNGQSRQLLIGNPRWEKRSLLLVIFVLPFVLMYARFLQLIIFLCWIDSSWLSHGIDSCVKVCKYLRTTAWNIHFRVNKEDFFKKNFFFSGMRKKKGKVVFKSFA